ncbi:penicillin acylase family protein [Flavobacteriaceae bacterium]|nr:penicillin acylase family protein [Flavobacteriaceae bacterium]
MRFGKNKTNVASIISYGSSNHPDSPHYSDQMEMYRRFETKLMHFDRENVIKDAKRIYHPN